MTNYHDIQFGNNAYGTLSQAYATTATSIVLTTGHGARFPTLTGSKYFFATLLDTSNNLEIIKVTARTNDTLTVVRAQEGTTARAFNTNDRIELRVTAGGLAVLGDLDEILPDQSAANGQVLTSSSGTAGFTALDITDFSSTNNTNTGFFSLPRGTTVQRPASSNQGYLRYNTDHYGGARPEYYAQNSEWLPLNSPILNKYVVCATAAASGDPAQDNGRFPTAGGAWQAAGFTANQFPLTPINNGTHNILSIILKPMSANSVFLIEVQGSFLKNGGSTYAYATLGRTIATTAAGSTAAASTVNVGHLRRGGDGTSNAVADGVAAWNQLADYHCGGFATYDQPNTTDFVRYCIHFSSNSNSHYIYFPVLGIGTMTVTELDGTGTTKVATDAPLEVNS